MNSIAVKNYRSINESPLVDLKPITVLVGKNSAGKSSFIRLFPLLKQSVERTISDSLLWYGDYVDLGDFNQAVSHSNSKEPIELEFSIDAFDQMFHEEDEEGIIENVVIKLTINEKYISKYSISFYDQNIIIEVDERDNAHITINGNDSIFDEHIYAHRDGGNLLPTILWEHVRNGEHYFTTQIDIEKEKYDLSKYIFPKGAADRFGRNPFFYSEVFDGFTSRQGIMDIFATVNPTKFVRKSIKDRTFIKYANLLVAYDLRSILARINDSIKSDMMQTNYIKPIRAQVDRYYRVQGLRVDELDADGSNLPIILKNFTKNELAQFEKWSKEKFGVVFSVETYEGHISMVVKDNVDSDTSTNVADTGYGYSQMLPIVLLLWMIHTGKCKKSNFRIKNPNRTIVIEQPELHLHPAFQAKMMDVFVNVVKEAQKKKINLKLIFETHSETMINRIGELIEAEHISQEEVNVLIFDKIEGRTEISSMEFDSKGLLKGWPTNFFSPEEWL